MLENFRLRVFREVANQASFRRAAEVLYITQPAVTQQIKALEEELGSRLFDRSGGKVRLTAAGEVLLRHADEAEATLSRAVEEIGSLEGEVRGALRVAASTTIAQYVLPRLLAEFARQHQGVRLELESANTQRVVEAVASGDAPIGLIEGPAHRQDLVVERWLEDELVLVVPAGHEWADEEIALSTLGSAKLLVRERGSGTREVIEQASEASRSADSEDADCNGAGLDGGAVGLYRGWAGCWVCRRGLHLSGSVRSVRSRPSR